MKNVFRSVVRMLEVDWILGVLYSSVGWSLESSQLYVLLGGGGWLEEVGHGGCGLEGSVSLPGSSIHLLSASWPP